MPPPLQPSQVTSLQPVVMRIPEAVIYSGLSRSELYRMAAKRQIIFRKSGRTTLVDVNSLKHAMENLPIATVTVGTNPQAQ